MRWNRKASLEIGVNTIVILVIAMVLLGLGVGFIRGLFSKAGELPELIDTDSLGGNPPTASDPIKITPSQVELKGGDSREVKVGVYNKENTEKQFTITIPECTGSVEPDVKSLSATIQPGESQAFKVIVKAADSDDNRFNPDKYICKLTATGGSTTSGGSSSGAILYSTQFIMNVVS